MAGDSHTGFDQQAFAVGAVGGAATIAGAIGAGIRNLAVARRERGMVNVVQSRDITIRSLQRRVDNQSIELERRGATIRDQDLTIRELALKLAMAQYLRRQGH
jgi:hypothetical protein